MVPPWPEGLPAPEARAGGVFVPAALDEAIGYRLRYLDAYPELCQVALDAQGQVLAARAAAAVDVERARAQARALELAAGAPPPGWAWYEVALAVGGGVAAGMLAGFAAAGLAR